MGRIITLIIFIIGFQWSVLAQSQFLLLYTNDECYQQVGHLTGSDDELQILQSAEVISINILNAKKELLRENGNEQILVLNDHFFMITPFFEYWVSPDGSFFIFEGEIDHLVYPEEYLAVYKEVPLRIFYHTARNEGLLPRNLDYYDFMNMNSEQVHEMLVGYYKENSIQVKYLTLKTEELIAEF